jgi:hypothetical protein
MHHLFTNPDDDKIILSGRPIAIPSDAPTHWEASDVYLEIVR